MSTEFVRKQYLEVWRGDTYLSRHVDVFNAAESIWKDWYQHALRHRQNPVGWHKHDGPITYYIKVGNEVWYEVPTADVNVFNVSADEPGGDDVIAQISGVRGQAQASGVAAGQASTGVDVSITGALGRGRGGGVSATGGGGAGLKRWNPGHGINTTGKPAQDDQDAYWQGVENQINNISGYAFPFKHVQVGVAWGMLDRGQNAPIALDYTRLESVVQVAKNVGVDVIFQLTHKYFTNNSNSSGFLAPPWASSHTQYNTGGGGEDNWIVYLWRKPSLDSSFPDIEGRFIQMLKDVADHFEDEPTVNAVSTAEVVFSVGGLPGPPDDYSLTIAKNFWLNTFNAMGAHMNGKKMNYFAMVNHLGNVQNTADLIETLYQGAVGKGAPDTRETSGHLVFQNDVPESVRDYRGQIPNYTTISTPDWRSGPQDFESLGVNFVVTSIIPERGANYVFWSTNTGVPSVSFTDIQNTLLANPNTYLSGCPARYPGCSNDPPPTGGSGITGISFNMSTVRNIAPGNGVDAEETDNWPICWASDGNQYTSFGDGWGFSNLSGFENTRASIGFSRISGGKDNYSAQDMSKHGKAMPDSFTGKCQGMFAANNKIYCSWDYRILESVDPGGGSRADAYIASTICKSEDWGATWTEIIRWNNSDWGGAEPANVNGFFAPTFLQFGQNNAGARDNYVYLYLMEHDNGDYQVQIPGGISLARCLLSNLESGNKGDWEFVTSIDANNVPTWSTTLANRAMIFQDAADGNHVSQVCFNAPLNRYILTTLQGVRDVPGAKFGCYDAPEPWGPWTQVLKQDATTVGPGLADSTADACILWGFSNKWLSADGLNFVMVGTLTGDDEWGTVEGTFTVG